MNLKRPLTLLLILSLLFTVFTSCTVEKEKTELSDEEKALLLKEAYIYTLPLMILDATFTKMTNTVNATNLQAPPNRFIHALSLANADFKNVVTPNVDTIYSQVFYDLSNDSLILEFPKTDRFCTVEIMDAYTNCISIIDAAKFEAESEKYIFIRNGSDIKALDGMKIINSPTDIGWVIVRTICNNTADEANVHEIQSKMKSYTLSTYLEGKTNENSTGSFSAENDFIPVNHIMNMGMAEYFERANELMKNNPPTAADREFINRIARINVGSGLKFDVSLFGDSFESLWENIVSQATSTVTEGSMKFMTKNGIWSYMGDPIAEFGTEYNYRALIALVGLGANPISVAVYPKATTDINGNKLNGKNSYILHFENNALPPVLKYGFWSVTVYDSNTNLLIDNEIDRYCINDRTDLKFNIDGSLDILIQAENPCDENINWLPVNDGDFHFVLRIYFPDETVLSGSWKAPIITKK